MSFFSGVKVRLLLLVLLLTKILLRIVVPVSFIFFFLSTNNVLENSSKFCISAFQHASMTMTPPPMTASLSFSPSTNSIKNCHHIINNNNNNNHDDHQDKINPNIRWLESSSSSPSSPSSSSVDNNNKQKDQIAYEYINFSSDDIHDDKTKTTTVLFCNGYQSSSLKDGGGRKVKAIKRYCMDHKISFCSFDYRGCGISTGNITDFILSDWIDDACQILETISSKTKTTHEKEEHQSGESKQQQQQKEDRTNSNNNNNNNNRIMLVGSSMGVTIALHIAMMYPSTCISGILGIASAPDFFQDLYYNNIINNNNVDVDSSSSLKLIKAKQQQQQDDDDDDDENNNLFYHLQTEYNVDPYIIPWELIQDAKENWNLLNDYNNNDDDDDDNNTTAPKKNKKMKIPIKCPIYLVHGQCDKDVSWEKTMELSDQLESTQVTSILIKDGDHRLSRKEDLDIICESLGLLIQACSHPPLVGTNAQGNEEGTNGLVRGG